MIQKIGGKRHNIFFLVVIFLLLTACKKVESIDDTVIHYENNGFAVGNGNYLYYTKFAPSKADLYKYDLISGEECLVDNIYNSSTNVFGMIKMFNIDNKIFYGKSIKNGMEIYSIEPDYLQPVFEGRINEELDSFNGEYPTYEFRMYKYEDNIYVLANNKIYILNNGNAEVVYDKISSLYIDDNKCYYSLIKEESSYFEPMASSGLWCYDLKSKENKEIISENMLKDYNSIETVSGNVCGIQNIIVSDKQIYFLSTYDETPILMFDNKTRKIENLTHSYRTKLFKKYKNKIYFINTKHQLCSKSENNKDIDVIIKDVYVYNFSIYNNKIYYYEVTDNRGHPSRLVEFDINKQTRRVISENE